MTQQPEIIELTQRRGDLRRFCRVPYDIYRSDPNWVAPILMDLYKALGPANPFFAHARMKLWMAMKWGTVLGRVAGIVDDNHNTVHHDRAAFFGFFECIDEPTIARSLVETVAAWAKAQGMTHLLGPMNPSTNDECGLLVDGFDSPPVVMMTYNPRYYPALLEQAGCSKAKDLLAFRVPVTEKHAARLERLAKIAGRHGPAPTLRPIRRKTLRQDLEKVKEVYNEAWADNWGFVPMTEGEIDFMAQRMAPLLDERLVFLVETPSEPVAFILVLPDYNQAFAKLRGRLLTPALLGALPYLMRRRATRFARMMAMGIKKSYRQKGLDALMLAHVLRAQLNIGIEFCEVSWVLEDNGPALRLLQTLSGECYKTYRIYDRPV